MCRIIIILIVLGFGNSIPGQSVKLYQRSAEQFAANGYYEDALEQLKKALELDPQNGELWSAKAKINEKAGNSALAAIDFRNAAVFGYSAAENFYNSARLLFQIKNFNEAEITISKAIDINGGDYDEFLLQSQIYLASKKYIEAKNSASKAYNSKGTAYAQYLMANAQFYLKEYPQAEENLNKVINKDRFIYDAFLKLALIQLISKETQFALENCNYVIKEESKNAEAYFIRSKVFAIQRDYEKAINDISMALSLDSLNLAYFKERAGFFYTMQNYSQAISDLTIVLNIDPFDNQALKMRGESYEKLNEPNKAVSDYSFLITLIDETDQKLLSDLNLSIFELNREEIRPEITLLNPVLNDNLEAMIPEDRQTVTVKIQVNDDSPLRLVKINNDTLINDTSGIRQKDFIDTIPFAHLDFIALSATDIYGNVSTISYSVEGIETKAPEINLYIPFPDPDNLITLAGDEKYLYLEGKIQDENLIQSIFIDDVTASFAPGDNNPRFTATIDISKKNKLKLRAKDINGNESEIEYIIRRNDQSASFVNPMGKTWVILIANSEYKDFSNLQSPQKDIELMQQALNRYQVNKFIVKKNLTKREMERFFSIDLRDLVRANNVNSLLVWFGGHGKNINGTGYWIPSDAISSDEFSFYNVNALKASLFSYTTLTHILVVSDACESGDGFCLALRGPIEGVSCSSTALAERKSAQVLTSAGSGYAFDDSLFSRAFANTLLNNEDDCSSIEDIVNKVNIIMQTNSMQMPEFGRIPGLTDELGTFFFYSY